MPLTAAERQKLYRQRLKENNPEKFLLQQRKNAERTKQHRKKISDYDTSEQEMIRKQWRDKKRRAKVNISNTLKPPSENEQSSNIRNPDVTIKRLKKRNRELYNENKKVKQEQCAFRNTIKNMKKRLRRQMKRNEELLQLLNEKNNLIWQLQGESDLTQQNENHDEQTPRTKTDTFIENNLPTINNAEKERVKKKILQHHITVEALKQSYQNIKTIEDKQLFKKVILNTKAVQKYKMKTKMASFLGLKGKIRNTIKKKRNPALLNHLRDFYERDDVSRMTAGKNEVKSRNKEKRQRRYLLGTLKQLHLKYRREGGKLGLTTFKKYRPFHVIAPKAANRNTCACKKHENLQMKAKALKSVGVIVTQDINELLAMIMCNTKSKECAYGECELCKEKSVDFNTNDQNHRVISWFEWVLKSHEYTDKADSNKTKITKRMAKEKKTGTLESLLNLFTQELWNCKEHSYNIIHQYNEYRRCIQNLNEKSVALHIDFSENCNCKLSTEIQSMHFGASRQQFTLHTGMLYSANNKKMAFASISPNNDHGPDAIWAHLLPVLQWIKEKNPTVDVVHFWSDGPTVQYKQKKNFYLFSKYTKCTGFDSSTWNFFEASHGKGAADGVGGAIKRHLEAFVAYGIDVTDAKKAFDLLQASDTKVKLFYIPDNAIHKTMLDLIPVPNTMKLHQIINTVTENSILYRSLSCFCPTGKPGFCDCLDLKQAYLIKKEERQHNKPKPNVKKPVTVTVLADIKNTPENKAYFDLTKYGPFAVTKITKDFDVTLKENKLPLLKQVNTTCKDKETQASGSNVCMNTVKFENMKKRKFGNILLKSRKKIKSQHDASSSTTDDSYSLRDSSEYNLSDDEDAQSIKSDTSSKSHYQRNTAKPKKMPKTTNIKIEKNETNDEIMDVIMKSKGLQNNSEQTIQEQSEERENDKKVVDVNNGIGTNKQKKKDEGNAIERQELCEENRAYKNTLELHNDVILKNMDNESTLTTEVELEMGLCFGDTVLVRYFQRASWKYYVGFIEDIIKNEEKYCYKISFLKKIIRPSLKFIVPKKKDEDTVPINLIMKKIGLKRSLKNKNEYFLKNTYDEVYFD